jgi:hypothetical protein
VTDAAEIIVSLTVATIVFVRTRVRELVPSNVSVAEIVTLLPEDELSTRELTVTILLSRRIETDRVADEMPDRVSFRFVGRLVNPTKVADRAG